ncbi:hypothetical protein H6504_03515 [Candidatus Woesearchaeota archaeon]|nr:hypothetical protein [Candidatus Woesearchaeota archaeon]
MNKKAMTQEAVIKMALGVLVLLVLIFLFTDQARNFGGIVGNTCDCTNHEKALENACEEGETLTYGKLKEDCEGTTKGARVRCCVKK